MHDENKNMVVVRQLLIVKSDALTFPPFTLDFAMAEHLGEYQMFFSVWTDAPEGDQGGQSRKRVPFCFLHTLVND
jgi:hypothetical protein